MNRAPTTSNVVLTARFGPVKVGASTCRSGQAGHRPGEDPRPGDLGHPRRQHQPDPRALELPAEPAQSLRTEPPRAGARDDVGAEPLGDLGRLVLATDDRHAGDRLGALRAGPDDRVARLGDVAQRGDEPGEVPPVADDDHRVAEPALGALGAEPPPPDPAGEEEPGQPEGQRDEEEASSQLQLEQVADDGQGREQAHGGRGDGAVLLRPVSEEPRVVGVVHAERHQPEHDENDGDHGVVQPERRRLGSVRLARGRAEPHELGADDRPDDDERVGDRDPERVPLDTAAGAGRRPSDRRGHPARTSGSPESGAPALDAACGRTRAERTDARRERSVARSHNRPATTPTIPTANQTVMRTALPTTTSTPSRYSRCRVANHRSGPPR